MNLINFEKEIAPVILDRGHDYFESGNVCDLQQMLSGEWVAEVDGNYGDYHVVIKLDNGYFHKYETSMASPPQKLMNIFPMRVPSLASYTEKRMIR